MARYVFIATVILAVVFVDNFTPSANAARILGLFPTLSPSHMLIHGSVSEALAEAGHDVTVISNVKNFYKNAKYRYVKLDTGIDTNFFAEAINNPKNMIIQFFGVMDKMTQFANASLVNSKTQEILAEHKEKPFDLLILGYFMNEFYLGLSAQLNCPVVLSLMIRPVLTINRLVGNPYENSYVPNMMAQLQQPMNFWGRVKNFIFAMIEQNGLSPYLNSIDEKFYNYHFPADRYPPLSEVRKNISLVLTNHHFSQGPIRPNVPALIEIGGIQIKEKPDPLPADLAEVMDNAKNGIIYFSLGSNVKGSILSKEKTKIMFDVLSQLPYTVLWKWGDSDFPGISPNIIYKSWLPQDDVLAHPNVKLFVTHGGQGSVVESQYHGVPMVGIPLFGDQPSNMANVVLNGFGRLVQYANLNEEDFRAAILDVLNNSKYRDAVKLFSLLYRDRPLSARQSVVYWVEYVIRHKGAKHMQSPAVHLNGWQLMSLDVIGFLLATIAVVLVLFAMLCRCLCNRRKNIRQLAAKSKKDK